jgi:mitogen-activated protein kinase organizer 1
VTSVSFSNDENCILASCMDNSLRLIDCSNGELLNTFKGHAGSSAKINSCFGLKDEFVISASENRNIYVWNLLEGNIPLKVFEHAHNGVISCVKYNNQTKTMISCSADGKVKVWKSVD